jgi:hypothetical protein
MLSLDNTYSTEELTAFHERVKKGLGGVEPAYVVEPKIDGIGIELRYVEEPGLDPRVGGGAFVVAPGPTRDLSGFEVAPIM